MHNSDIRILTYNIHKGFTTGNVRFVLHQIREQLRQADVDIVFLQEIQGEHSKRSNQIPNWPDATQFEFLADTIWPHYTYGKNAIYNSGHHGNAILSKYPFVFWENTNVSSLRQASRSVLHGVIEVGEHTRPIHLLCIHFDLFAFERERQLNTLNEHIAKHVPQDESVIIAGDFNDWHNRAHRHLAKGLHLKEVFQQLEGRHAKTYPAWMPMLPMDRIYYRNLEAIECDCLRHAPWYRLSDHAPLYARLNYMSGSKHD
ncbi:MAG: endonuclease/exonuclease/phosphatase family protein [Gammaproteobacteria bacterium]|nr:endonuclease/exonuclease/phosphatase family protein [Gammaproteobacteria bacterium]